MRSPFIFLLVAEVLGFLFPFTSEPTPGQASVGLGLHVPLLAFGKKR